jgi:hypothetical protein
MAPLATMSPNIPRASKSERISVMLLTSLMSKIAQKRGSIKP